ncbi:MAG: hypothetical protein KIT45_06645 [Fimbriimonadia bacterium]|nr:hypothetical protein [Fimbriimonadia bacterium]
MRRNYLHIGRDVYHKHPDAWTSDEWRWAREFCALALIEQEELHGD